MGHLALLSQADVFDQVTNPEGLQRDLSTKHASDAYEYVHRPPDPERPRAFPEVVINVRDKSVLKMERIDADGDNPEGFGARYRLVFDLEKIREGKGGKITVSRTDGNHRLFYAAGDERRDPLLAVIPFQVQTGLGRTQEASLFVDINSNQKGLNTSHLSVIRSRLTPEEEEIKAHLDRWIAKRLVDDPDSPLHGLVHLGGSKKGSRAQGLSRPVNFTSIQNGVKRLLEKSQYIHDLTHPAAQYAIIKNYWKAVKTVFAEEWANPKRYLLLKNMGVWSLSILGGTIIDRCIPRGNVGRDDMARYLRQAKSRFDWSRDATGDRAVTGMSGNRAAMIIAGEMAMELSDETGANLIKELQDKLVAEASSVTS
jgi:DGQHR domain-containing protein